MVSPVGSLLPPGERHFGSYELVAKLATGGMAEIFLARRRGAGTSESLVIKRVLPHLAEDERFLAMFRDEARLASSIIHPNVCRVLEAGTVGHTYFMAMEYLHGVPLSQVLFEAARAQREIDLRRIAAMVQQSCAGLHHAHELVTGEGAHLEVVHRDVSPPNIFVTAAGVTKLLDFGVAKARGATQKTRTGTVKGKNSYMSPEQILGKEVDRRSDIFSLGVVMWESLTARRLFARETDFLTFRAITDDPIPSPCEYRDLPPALGRVVERSLARDRNQRFASAAEMAAAIDEAMAPHGGVATTDELAAFIEAEFATALASRAALHQRMTAKFPALARVGSMTMDLVVEEVLSDDEPEPSDRAPARPVTDTDEIARPRPRRSALLGAALGGAALAVLGLALFSRGSDRDLGDARDRIPAASIAASAERHAPAPRRALAADLGYLTVDAVPQSTVLVDGVKVGETPLVEVELEPGVHRLELVAAGRKRRERLRIRAGRTTNLGRLVWTKR